MRIEIVPLLVQYFPLIFFQHIHDAAFLNIPWLFLEVLKFETIRGFVIEYDRELLIEDKGLIDDFFIGSNFELFGQTYVLFYACVLKQLLDG
jgi:hypothetical protein